MPRDFLKDAKDEYDVVVIGSGLGGLTAANVLAQGRAEVLLLEQHYKLGGLATWFKRPGGHIFDISLHGFPYGMVKSCRRYWTQEIADSIVQLKHIRFDNPMFSLTTTFNRDDFTRLLVKEFKVEPAAVNGFFDTARGMNFYDDQSTTTRELFESFFPAAGCDSAVMEPITYANGSTLEDPAISYGIVFSNFMSKGVFTFEGGTDRLIALMGAELRKERRRRLHQGRSPADRSPGRRVRTSSTAARFAPGPSFERQPERRRSSSSLAGTFRPRICREARAVRLNNPAPGLHGLRPDEQIDEQRAICCSAPGPAFRPSRS